MSYLNRLQKKLSRLGIDVSYQNQTYHLSSNDSQATVLLPEPLRLEEKAVQQLLNFAAVQVPGQPGKVLKACATPDFHPGTIAPVGSVVATSHNLAIPAAIGTDINCGMRLIRTGITQSQALSKQNQIEQQLSAVLLHDRRDVPVTPQSFTALFDEGLAPWLDALPAKGLWQHVNFKRLHEELSNIVGLNAVHAHSRYAPEAFTEDRDIIRPASLGTVGAGNHFVELQVVDKILDRHLAYSCGLRADDVVIMLHTGSRDVGFYVGQRWIDRAKAAWPEGVKHPASGLFGLTDALAEAYMLGMGVAARYAWANRIVLTELIRHEWQSIFQDDNTALVVDIPHNIILPEHGMNIHRKGATPAHAGTFSLIPGSMGDYSYVATGLGNADWLWSCSHGAGRAVRRQQMRGAQKSNAPQQAQLPWHCIALNEARKKEEAPSAYKSIGPVIQAQEEAGLIQAAVRLRPWITFKV